MLWKWDLFVVFNTRTLSGVRHFSEWTYENCRELKVGCKLPHPCETHFLKYLWQRKNCYSFCILFLVVDDHEGDDAEDTDDHDPDAPI